MNYVFLLKVVLKRELNQLGITQMQSHANTTEEITIICPQEMKL